MKTSCDIYKEKGDYYFQNEYYFFFLYAYITPVPAGHNLAWSNATHVKKARLKDTT